MTKTLSRLKDENPTEYITILNGPRNNLKIRNLPYWRKAGQTPVSNVLLHFVCTASPLNCNNRVMLNEFCVYS